MSNSWQDWQPSTPELGDAPPDLDAQLTWMYRSLIDLWVADDRLTTTALYGTISRTADRRAAATGMTDMLGTLATTSADTYSLIGTAATAAATTGPASEAYFAPRAELAAVYESSANGMHKQLPTLSSPATTTTTASTMHSTVTSVPMVSVEQQRRSCWRSSRRQRRLPGDRHR